MSVEGKIDQLENKIEANNKDIWKAIGALTTDMAVMSTNVNNFIKSQNKIAFPCIHGQQLQKEFCAHIEEHKANERNWKSLIFRIAAGVIITALISAGSAAVGALLSQGLK